MSERLQSHLLTAYLLAVVLILASLIIVLNRQREIVREVSITKELLQYHVGRSDYAIDLLELRADSTEAVE